MNTHGMICDFGKHEDVPYTRIPVSYLKWMVNSNHSRKIIAQAELDRRGTVTPDMEISGHAIDRASLSCRDIWHGTSSKDEGLHAWLTKVAQNALKKGKKDKKGRYRYLGMMFAFTQDGVWPVLKTVMRDKEKNDGQK